MAPGGRHDDWTIGTALVASAHRICLASERPGRFRLVMVMPASGEPPALLPQVYADEAGKWHDQDFICLCGYLALESDWMTLALRWVDRLRHHGLLPAIHTSKFREQCRGIGKEDKADAIFDEFVEIARDHVRVGFAVAMDTRAFRDLPPHIRRAIGDPQLACTDRLLTLVRDRLVAEEYPSPICITFDDSDEYALATHKLVNRLRKSDPALRRYIAALTFADDESTQPVQAADMLASLTFRWLKERAVNPQAQLAGPLRKLIEHRTAKGYGADLHEDFWAKDRLLAEWQTLARIDGAP
jgi:hypothetical protein